MATTMTDENAAADAMKWLRETDKLTPESLKRAYYEDIRVVHRDSGSITVQNHSYADPADHEHTVEVTGEIVSSCTCPQFHYRGVVCKHQVAVALALERGFTHTY